MFSKDLCNEMTRLRNEYLEKKKAKEDREKQEKK